MMAQYVPCPICRRAFKRGRSLTNHMRTHKAGLCPGLFGSPTTAASSLPDGTDTATRHAHDGDSDDGFGDGLGDDPNRVLVPTVAEYLARLYDDGDLDITRVREFVGGANAVSCPADTKVFQFLAAMFGGRGSSTKQGNRMLKFLRPHLPFMPRTIKGCWRVVKKVRRRLHYRNVLLYVLCGC
jgi:hypothetical protein